LPELLANERGNPLVLMGDSTKVVIKRARVVLDAEVEVVRKSHSRVAHRRMFAEIIRLKVF
jgi:hypothetical protein